MVLTRARHREAVIEASQAIQHVGYRLTASGASISNLAELAPELIAEDLRLAARALGRITGRIDVEDILDLLFAEFCIGK